jgi:PAS domain S-box-containing protein
MDERQVTAIRIDRWLLDPVQSVSDEKVVRVRLVAMTLLSLFVSGLFVVAIYLGFDRNFELSIALPVTFVGLVISYGIARAGYPHTAIRLITGLLIVVIINFTISDPDNYNFEYLIYLMIPIGLATLFLSFFETLITSLSALTAIIMLPLFANDPNLEWVNLLDSILVIVLFSLLAIGGRFVRQRIRLIDRYEVERSEILLDVMSQAVLIVQGGIVRYVNPAGARLLGGEAVIGQPLSMIFPEHAHTEMNARRIRQGKYNVLETHESIQPLGGAASRMVRVVTASILYDGDVADQIIIEDTSQIEELRSEFEAMQQYHTVIADMMTDYTYELHYDGQAYEIRNLRGAFERVTGYQPDEAVIPDIRRVFHPDDRHIARLHYQIAFRGEPVATEARIIRKNGDVLWIREHARPYHQHDDKVTAILCVAQDISHQHRAEQALTTQAIQQAIIAEVGQRALNQTIDSQALMSEALSLLAQVLEADYARISRFNPQEQALVRVSQVGFSKNDDVPDICIIESEEKPSPAVYAFRNQANLVIESLSDEVRFYQDGFLYKQGITSGLCVVMQGEGDPLGVLEVYSIAHHKFSNEEANFVKAIANILTAYSDQQQAKSAEREQARIVAAQQEIVAALNSSLSLSDMLETILNNLERLIPHDAASIMLIEGDYSRVLRHSGFDQYVPGAADMMQEVRFSISENRIIQHMMEQSYGMIIPDVTRNADWEVVNGNDWIRSYLGAPILYQGEVLGVINVDSQHTNAFQPIHLNRLQSLANQVSIAIRNARRTQELEARVRQRTRELETERRRLAGILDSTGEGIFYAESGIIQYANDALMRMLQCDASWLIGHPVSIIFGSESETLATIRRRLEDEDIWREEAELYRQTGERFHAGITVSTLGADHSDRTVTLIRDISVEKALEAQKARFIANASHELRAPISSLNTRVYMLRRDPERTDYHLDLLERVIDRMNQLIEDLLDTSRFENGVIQLRRRVVVVQSLLNDVVELHEEDARQKGIQLESQLSQEPLQAYLDPERISQVMTNLITNALNYTPKGGRVALTCQHDQEHVIINVIDTGIGVKPADLPHVFQPFYRGENDVKGTGLGLSISREIVMLHDGRLKVESEPGQGSVFSVILPLAFS